MSQELTHIDNIPGMVQPEEAYESFIPDTLFPSSNDWEIPDLDIDMQAQEVAIPMQKWGEQASSVIIDIRDTSITPDNVRRQVRRNLADPDFKRPISRVWTYDGKKLQKVWG